MNGKLFIRLIIVFMTFMISGYSYAETSLNDKIGQMIMTGFRGMDVDENHFIIKDIRERNLGGVILFDYDVRRKQFYRNIESADQLKNLTEKLQSASPVPLLIAVDQEGGRIARLKTDYGFPVTFSHMELGGKDSPELTYKKTLKLAETLKNTGFNLNMAPVVDLCINLENPIIAKIERCFSDDQDKVSGQAVAYIKALHNKGILSTLKHFPGHGSSQGDSHLGLTDITKNWTEKELVPYKNIIDADQADVIMTAHVFNSRLDPDYPATLSEKIIGGILRQKLGFDKVVISDDMQMGAIVNYYGFETAIGLALKAGVDILVFGNNLHYDEEIVQKVIGIIKEMVKNGSISETRIDQSYQRIMKLKSGLL